MEFGPDANTGLEGQQPDALAAETESQHEQTRAPVLTGLAVANHGASALIDLRFLAGSGLNDGTRFRRLSSTHLADEAFDAFVGASETMLVRQLLPDGHGVPATGQTGFDEFAIRFAGCWRRGLVS